MRHAIRPVNSTGTSPSPHFLHAKLSSFVGSNIGWDTMVMNQAFCESTWWCWQKLCRHEKQMRIQNVYLFLWRQSVPPPWWKGVQCNQSATRWLPGPPQGMVPFWCLSIWFLLISRLPIPTDKSAVIDKSASVREDPIYTHHPSCHSHFVYGSTEEALG